MALASLAFVKQALRIDHSDDDVVLQAYIDASSSAVIRYLKSSADPAWTEETAPATVRIAITIAVQALYEPEQRDLLAGLGSGDPKNPLVALLYAMRDPALA